MDIYCRKTFITVTYSRKYYQKHKAKRIEMVSFHACTRAHVSHTFYCVNILVRLPLKPTLPHIYINYTVVENFI